MKTQIQTYLNRAMISARHGSLTSRTDALETVSRFLKTFNKLFPDISFELEQKKSVQKSGTSSLQMIFAGEEQDLEEVIGNILENAGKFAKKSVLVSMDRVQEANAEWIEISILDDGPGLTSEEIDYVMKRGNRLDENKPGTGLGLSIVSDILKEYGGVMKIESNVGEGLSVNIRLPAAN